MSDPDVWYTVSAQLDGIDTGSDNLQERMKFHVHQRRMILEAVRTKAMLLAMMGNTEAAGKAATAYIEMAVPVHESSRVDHAAELDAKMAEIAAMGPITPIVRGAGLRASPTTSTFQSRDSIVQAMPKPTEAIAQK